MGCEVAKQVDGPAASRRLHGVLRQLLPSRIGHQSESHGSALDTGKQYNQRWTPENNIVGHASASVAAAAAAPVIQTDHYYTYAELTEAVEAIAGHHPDLCSLSSIGQSREGRELWLLTLCDQSTGPAHTKPAYFICANNCLHPIRFDAPIIPRVVAIPSVRSLRILIMASRMASWRAPRMLLQMATSTLPNPLECNAVCTMRCPSLLSRRSLRISPCT